MHETMNIKFTSPRFCAKNMFRKFDLFRLQTKEARNIKHPLKCSTPCQALVLKRGPTFRLGPTFCLKTATESASKIFWGYSSTHSELRHEIEVSGQLYALAALLLWKEPSVLTEQDAG